MDIADKKQVIIAYHTAAIKVDLIEIEAVLNLLRNGECRHSAVGALSAHLWSIRYATGQINKTNKENEPA